MNIQHEDTLDLRVSGTGSSKQEAIADAVSKVSKTIMKKNEVTIQAQPESITVLRAEDKQYIEHFLFFFLPRERHQFNVDLSVSVKVKFLELGEIEFVTNKVADPTRPQLFGFLQRRKS